MENITYQIIDSVTKIKKDDWNLVFQDTPEGYQFYKTLEDSKLGEFSFYYITLYQGGHVLLIAPLFITDFNLDIAAEGLIERIIRIIRKFVPRFLILKTLFCGSPFSEHGALGIRKDVQDKGIIINELVKIMNGFAKEKNIPLIIFKDFLKEETLFLDSLQEYGFFKVKSFPSVVMGLNFASFDEYLKSLGHSTRKSLRRKLKNAYSRADIKVEITERVDNIANDIHRLYENTYHTGTTKFERLTRDFFISAGKNLSPNAKFFLYYVNGKLAAFNLCFVYKDLFIDKFIGFAYDISEQYSLYFLSWCFNIEWCLANSIRFYQTGQTDYGPKLKLGGRFTPLYAYLKHRHNIVNSLLKLLAVFLKPENFDEDIKNKTNV
jgi:predicted N-acyltransferase